MESREHRPPAQGADDKPVMAILRADVFQPPIPSLLLLVPPASRWQWLLRLILLGYTLVTIPLITVLVPLSVFSTLCRWAPLPLHPHNLPSYRSTWTACLRGWQVYINGGLIWAVTGCGAAPDHGLDTSRRLVRWAYALDSLLARLFGRQPSNLQLNEVIMSEFPLDLCHGALAMDGLDRRPVVGFTLVNETKASERPASPSPTERKRAILWLSGGGYVTGYPLVDPPLFSLMRQLPVGQYTMLGPAVRKSLSIDRSFPIPLLDALAGYAYLRDEGFEAEDIIVMGNSAGSGLSWSLISYLAALHDAGQGYLGVPQTVIMISPWLSLPPTPPSGYPDLIDEPQLLNAARCYLARFPVLPHRPDPFQSDWYLWQKALGIRFSAAVEQIAAAVIGHRSTNRSKMASIEKVEQRVLGGKRILDTPPSSHLGWFEESTFTQLSSHHPLISPATDLSSPFVKHTLNTLGQNGTRLLLYCGTAEWFYGPAIRFAKAARQTGMKVQIQEDIGGFHVEGCVMPPDFGGAAARQQECLLDYLEPRVR